MKGYFLLLKNSITTIIFFVVNLCSFSFGRNVIFPFVHSVLLLHGFLIKV